MITEHLPLRPGPRLLPTLAAHLALGVVASFLPPVQGAWWSIGAVLVGILLLELWALRLPPQLDVRRQLPAALSLGEWQEVTLRLSNRGRRALQVRVHDHYPADFAVRGQPFEGRIGAGSWLGFSYACRPGRRGLARFAPAAVRTSGPVALLARVDRLGEPSEARIYPNFRAVARHAMMAFSKHGAMAGIHLRRRRGHGLEFHQLREFRDGDSLRQVDWKSVSRRRQLISREYREERNQRVVFVLDCGRRMHARDGDASLLDRALDALLLLSYVALRQGDAVGVLTFSGDNRWLPPVSGAAAMQSILRIVHDIETSAAPSDFQDAARILGTRQPRRALAILLTNLRDDDSDDLPRLLAPLRRKHLVLVASLRDPALRLLVTDPVTDFKSALSRAAAIDYLARRKAAHALLEGRGLALLDVEPAELPGALVKRYMEIKRAGQL